MGSDIFDLLVILVLVFFALRGYWNGFILEFTGIVSLILAFVVANTAHPHLSPSMEFITNPTLRTILTYILLFVATILICSLLSRFLLRIRDFPLTRWIDTVAGFCFGLAKGILICTLLLYIIQAIFGDTSVIQKSRTIPYLSSLIAQIQAWLPEDLAAKMSLLK
ncbi:MAG: CvpA family protein [Desulfovibrio sp.]|nr:CvpA family protein [Desulfovibrio sp.]